MTDTLPDPTIATAQATAEAARARLGGTVAELKHRVMPHVLAHDAAESLKDKGMAMASDLAGVVKRRPATAAAVVGGLALFLVRKRVVALLRGSTPAAPPRAPSRSRTTKGTAR